MKRILQPSSRSRGFTLIELLVVMVIMALLAALIFPALNDAIITAHATVSTSNLRELATANLSYAADHNGSYCPAQDPTNLIRWHGARMSVSAPFDPSKGFLSPYLGENGKVKVCPLFANLVSGPASFETGTGGYGYNEIYIGGTPANNYQPTSAVNVPNPCQTVMFTTTAFAISSGLQEYPFCEAYQWVDPNNNLAGGLQPSVHFRDHGRALVAWCDGHVSAELPTQLGGADYYGGNSKQDSIGWFGPSVNNGYWNPHYKGP